MQKPHLVDSIMVRCSEPPLAEISISAEDHRTYVITRRQLSLIVRKGMEVLSRLEDGVS